MTLFTCFSFFLLCLSQLSPLATAHARGRVSRQELSAHQDRAWKLVQQMTFEEKISMLHGNNGTYVGNVNGIERLAIPSLNLHDGPQGFRTTASTGPEGSTTAWPSAQAAAASWDADLLYRWGAAMGKEFKGKGANVQLAPGIGIARVPTAGRNFEYLSGEDPILGYYLAEAIVQGIQDQGVVANAKHWVNNEIEDHRNLVSANVDERTRFEIYYPPFQGAINAGVMSAMCSYNRINDDWGCQNADTIGHLKETLGFEGWLMSDWTATHSTVDAKNSGLDQEMPFGLFFNEKTLQNALDNGTIKIETIDESVARILTGMSAIGLLDTAPTGDPNAIVTCDEHVALAREMIAKSIILLKNDNNLLPLRPESIKTIAVIGDQTTVSGTGSGYVEPGYVVTPTEGILNYIGGYNITVTYVDGKNVDEAVSLAKSSDVVIVTVATTSGEGRDRDSLSLGKNQDELVEAIAAVNSNVVVSVNTPGSVLMPWDELVSSVIVAWLPGQEFGNGLADVLFGKVNPSGKLLVTMPNIENEINFTPEQYPGVGVPPEAEYSEKLLIGYRYYDAKNIKPNFPFGHGLSYTTFKYSNLEIDQVVSSHSAPNQIVATVSFDITNTGAVAGTETPQLYVSYPSNSEEPPQQLRNFAKVSLAPGESKTVTLNVQTRDLSIWDVNVHDWSIQSGTFEFRVASSSRDIRLADKFTL